MHLDPSESSRHNDVAAERRRLRGLVARLEQVEVELDAIAAQKQALSEAAKELVTRRRSLLAEARNPQLCLAFDDEESADEAEPPPRAAPVEAPKRNAKPGTLLPPKPKARKPTQVVGSDPDRVRWPDEEDVDGATA